MTSTSDDRLKAGIFPQWNFYFTRTCDIIIYDDDFVTTTPQPFGTVPCVGLHNPYEPCIWLYTAMTMTNWEPHVTLKRQPCSTRRLARADVCPRQPPSLGIVVTMTTQHTRWPQQHNFKTRRITVRQSCDDMLHKNQWRQLGAWRIIVRWSTTSELFQIVLLHSLTASYRAFFIQVEQVHWAPGYKSKVRPCQSHRNISLKSAKKPPPSILFSFQCLSLSVLHKSLFLNWFGSLHVISASWCTALYRAPCITKI